MTDLSWKQYIEYSEDEYLTNSYSLVNEGCEFEQHDNKVTEQNNALLRSPLLVFDNKLEESFFSTYSTTERFENHLNETIEPSFILLNPNNNNLDFFENISEETNCSSIY